MGLFDGIIAGYGGSILWEGSGIMWDIVIRCYKMVYKPIN